eukprot:CAMPEP_0168454170 /NCGR_PEP_ID=MMETSP0228-20121227/50079_1 /TAXON_ID=133427 /ORGANISM="Protoceratium reticulatum, Strain CCCM 535 (=CCMP 1889)" /LENGTH=213 /DNA_ID=CAMNT_0008468941 /DNA_START=8 /DNA_END=646 /DNA_ORIENTATION=+
MPGGPKLGCPARAGPLGQPPAVTSNSEGCSAGGRGGCGAFTGDWLLWAGQPPEILHPPSDGGRRKVPAEAEVAAQAAAAAAAASATPEEPRPAELWETVGDRRHPSGSCRDSAAGTFPEAPPLASVHILASAQTLASAPTLASALTLASTLSRLKGMATSPIRCRLQHASSAVLPRPFFGAKQEAAWDGKGGGVVGPSAGMPPQEPTCPDVDP